MGVCYSLRTLTQVSPSTVQSSNKCKIAPINDDQSRTDISPPQSLPQAPCLNNNALSINDAVEDHIRDESGLLYKEATSNSSNLIAAVKRGDFETVKQILTEDEKSINIVGMWSSTPLITATQYGYTEIALYLLSFSAVDVHHLNEKGAGALLFSCMENQLEIVKQLLSRGVNIFPPFAPSIYNASLDRNVMCTPFSIACCNGCDEVIRALVHHGCSVNHKFDFNALPLTMNPQNKGEPVCELSPLMLACAYGKPAAVATLLELHANPYLQCSWGNSCLHYAARCGKFSGDVLKVFFACETIDIGCFNSLLTMENKHGDTCLHCACESKAVEFVQLLVDKFGSASINIRNSVSGATPLHIAIKKRSNDLVKYLLEHGADPLAEDARGVNPLDLAGQLKKDSPLLLAMEAAATSRRAKRAVQQAAAHTISDAGLEAGTNVLSNQNDDVLDKCARSLLPSGIDKELLKVANNSEFPVVEEESYKVKAETGGPARQPVRPTAPSKPVGGGVVSSSARKLVSADGKDSRGPITGTTNVSMVSTFNHSDENDDETPEGVRSVTPVLARRLSEAAGTRNGFESTPSRTLAIDSHFITPAAIRNNNNNNHLMLTSITPSCIETIFDPTPVRHTVARE